MPKPLASSSCLSRCFSSWQAPSTGVFGQPGGLVAQIELLAAGLTVFTSSLSTPQSEQHRRWALGWGVRLPLKTSPGFPAATTLGAGRRCCRLTSGGCCTHAASSSTLMEARGQGCSNLSAGWDEPAQPSTAGRHRSPPGPSCSSIPPATARNVAPPEPRARGARWMQCESPAGQAALVSRGAHVALSTATQVAVPLLVSSQQQDNERGEAERAWAFIRVRSELGARY